MFILLVLSIDHHESLVYLIPESEKELIERLEEFHGEIDYFDQTNYSERQQETIEILAQTDRPKVDLDEFAAARTVLPVTIVKIINLCMSMT
jgi:signal-transduction protein with cAMP-binding, CBS, and nucleotidyltransferase domain